MLNMKEQYRVRSIDKKVRNDEVHLGIYICRIEVNINRGSRINKFILILINLKLLHVVK